MIKNRIAIWGHLCTLLLALLPLVAQGQVSSSCEQSLLRAQQAYDDGKLQAVPALLDKCIRNGFSQEERIKAYRLLTLAYLFSNNNEMADDTFEKLLRLAPDFTVDENTDPVELIKLYKSYRTSPILSFTALVGPNYSNPISYRAFSTHSDDGSVGKYDGGGGLQSGLGIEIHLNNHWSVQAQAMYVRERFSMTQLNLLGFTALTYRENNNYLSLPVSLKYQFGKKRLLPYVFAGASARWLLQSTASAERRQDSGRDVTAAGIDMSGLRQRRNYTLLGGAGVSYKIKRTAVFAAVQYHYGLKNYALPDVRYSNNELLYKFGYLDHDFRVGLFSASIGFTFHLYNPKKLKRDKNIEKPNMKASEE